MTSGQRIAETVSTGRFGVGALLDTVGVFGPEDFDPARLYVANGTLSRLHELARIAELKQPEALFAAWKVGKVTAWTPAGMQGGNSLDLAGNELLAAFRSGSTLYFRSVEANVPQLRELADDLAEDLGVAPRSLTCEAFVSSSGGGSRMHFDPNMTFNIQMVGTKTWRTAENKTTPNPHTGFAVGSEPSPELMRYARGDFPLDMPADAAEFKTQPGSVVYLPHGIWHQTQTTDVSLSLLFTVLQEDWGTLIARRLAARLRDHPAWREIPIGLRTPTFWRNQRTTVSNLLEELRLVVASITPEQLVEEIGGPQVLIYSIRNGLYLEVTGPEQADETWTLTLSSDGQSGSRPVTPEIGAILDWIARRRHDFTGLECLSGLPESNPETVVRVLGDLQRRGILSARAFAGSDA